MSPTLPILALPATWLLHVATHLQPPSTPPGMWTSPSVTYPVPPCAQICCLAPALRTLLLAPNSPHAPTPQPHTPLVAACFSHPYWVQSATEHVGALQLCKTREEGWWRHHVAVAQVRLSAFTHCLVWQPVRWVRCCPQ